MTSVTIGDPDLHIEDPNLIGRRWRTGVLLLILADAAFVAALVFSYFYLRGLNTQHAWLKPHQHTASIGFGWIIAGITVASAASFAWAYRGIKDGDSARLVRGCGLAFAVVLTGCVVQVLQLCTFDFGVADSAYSSALYVLGGANLFHLLLTAFLGLGMFNRSRLGIYTQDSHWQVRLVGMWWTWIAAAAVLGAFTTSFVTSPNHGG